MGVEADEVGKGKITFDEFGKLIDLAAAPPRFFGWAPNTSDAATRRAMFDEMDSTKSGFITFRKFLRFTRVHIRAKLAAPESDFGDHLRGTTDVEEPKPELCTK